MIFFLELKNGKNWKRTFLTVKIWKGIVTPMSHLFSRSAKTSAFGVVNNGQKCNIGGEELPPVGEDAVVQYDDDNIPKCVLARDRKKKYKIELASVDTAQLVDAARRAVQTVNGAIHHSIMPQNMMDATNVVKSVPPETPTEDIVAMIGVAKPASLTVAQYDEMVRAWYWGMMGDTVLEEKCTLTIAAYRCFGWVLDVKLSGKRKTLN